jgi:nucleoside-diphosphate-sugar epimerase
MGKVGDGKSKGSWGKGVWSMGMKGKGKKGKGAVVPGPKGKYSDKGKGKGKGKSDTSTRWTAVKPTVLVTGCGGYLAAQIVRQLFTKGYKVKGTVRSLTDEAKIAPLKSLFPNIQLVEADLLGGSDAFEKAMDGCTYVIHAASPFKNKVDDPQKDLIDPALQGTEAVLMAAAKVKIERVVVTSSVAACGPPQAWLMDASKGDSEKRFSEDDWNEDSTLTDGPYRLSKTLAEKKAWELSKAHNIPLVTILPSFVLGPMLTNRADGESISWMTRMLDGRMQEEGCKGFPFSVVDVRDCALAHVAALETDEAVGKRFVCAHEEGFPWIKLAEALRADSSLQAYAIPTTGPIPEYIPKFSAQQAADVLKFKARSVESTLRDMANAAIRLGLVEKKSPPRTLRPAVFQKVEDIVPDSKGINLVLVVTKTMDRKDIKGGAFREVVAGDSSGVVTLLLAESEEQVAEVGATIDIRNAVVRMVGGFIRLAIGKWGKVSKHTGETEITPNSKHDISSTEYELVPP